jgi:DivIVA domain-containing protein
MVDESFHLTPLDVRRYDFGSALRGYDKARVDQFRDQVHDELERLTRLTQDLEAKARGFHEQLRAFRERDKALNDALVSAQQLRAEIREQADRESQLILREARVEGERLVEEAKTDIRRLQAEVDALERTRRTNLAQLRALVQRQLTDIEAAEAAGSPAASADARPAAETAAPADGAPRRPTERDTRTPTWLDASVPE